MKSSAKPEVQLLLDACHKGGVTHIVLSPGSRNAPLSIAFDEHPDFTTYVIPDERAAAFYALGMAQQLNRPVAIACTSGSAPLNYFPAIAEAYYQGVPLVVLTADRPTEWVDQGDGQTIVQAGVFGSHVLKFAQLNPFYTESQRWLFERNCAEVIQTANGKRKGPVHLNIPFSEPLYEISEANEKIQHWISVAQESYNLSDSDKQHLIEIWNKSTKRMILCGQHSSDPSLLMALEKVAEDQSVAVLTEHTSNMVHPKFVQCIDRSLNQIHHNETDYQPEVLVVLGGAVISKRIKTFLRKAIGLKVISIGNNFPFMDTFQALKFTTTVKAVEVLGILANRDADLPPASLFGTKWKQLDYLSGIKHEEILKNVAFSDLKAMEILLDSVPEQAHLHLANSSIIRYALLFDPVKSIRYWCNRGTSGIDGSSSTACGAALIANQHWHVLISGDMSFFYDSNAFWSHYKPLNLRVFVLNNGGGDIFNIIPGPDTTAQKDKYFVAKQGFSAEYICKAYGLDYFRADSVESIDRQLDAFFAVGDAPKLMEINTATIENSAVLKAYFEQSKS